MNILFICPGGQTIGQSPSERLAKEVEKVSGWSIDNIVITFTGYDIFNKIDYSKYDLIWSDMDGSSAMQIAIQIKDLLNKKVYIHGEWIPPYRFEIGWEPYYNETDQTSLKEYYHKNIIAMSKADLLSLAIPDDLPGGKEWIEKVSGIKLNNYFLRPQYFSNISAPTKVDRSYSVATIARINDGKKRVNMTLQALEKIIPQPIFNIIGGNLQSNKIKINNFGTFDNKDKLKIYENSIVSVQHWSGIPPAESIQKLCPVISFDMPEMRDLYGDLLIWVEKDNVDLLSNTIKYVLDNPVIFHNRMTNTREKLLSDTYGIKSINTVAKDLIKRFSSL